jgi:hypothetical protein
VSIAWVRIGDARGWTVATRSDGSVLVTRTRERKGGGSLGIGLEASPIGLDVGVEGKLDVTVTSGETWEFPDAAAASRFLAGHSDAAPTWRFGQAGEVLTGEADAKLGGARVTGIEASARAAAGVRVGRGRTTLYIHTLLDSGATVWLPRHAAQVAGPTSGDAMVELTYEHGAFRELAFHTVAPGGEPGHVVETLARLDLRDPANRAAAAHLITRRPPWPADVVRELRTLMLYTVQHGTVERAVYEVRDESSDFELAARLGEELGLQIEEVRVQRRLVAASAWTPGSRERLREDCLT